jgi:hypothetical protein
MNSFKTRIVKKRRKYKTQLWTFVSGRYSRLDFSKLIESYQFLIIFFYWKISCFWPSTYTDISTEWTKPFFSNSKIPSNPEAMLLSLYCCLAMSERTREIDSHSRNDFLFFVWLPVSLSFWFSSFCTFEFLFRQTILRPFFDRLLIPLSLSLFVSRVICLFLPFCFCLFYDLSFIPSTQERRGIRGHMICTSSVVVVNWAWNLWE